MPEHRHIDTTGFEQRCATYRARGLRRRVEAALSEPDAPKAYEGELRVPHWGPLAPLADGIGAIWQSIGDFAARADDAVQALGDALGDLARGLASPVASGAMTLAEAFELFSAVLPREDWPRLFLAADSSATDRLIEDLRREGLLATPADRGDDDADLDGDAEAREFERYGVFVVRVPPDGFFANRLASLAGLRAMADPEVPVGIVRPLAARGAFAEVAPILDVPDGARERLGDDVTIAILDTGIDRGHPDLAHVADEDVEAFAGGGPDDRLGHGTHCAGIAAGTGEASGGRFAGVAPRARLVVGKVFGTDGYANLDAVVRGIRWAHEDRGADIISLSLGATGYAPGESVVTRVCEALFDQGVLVCAAAGNDGPAEDTISAPGDGEDVITVGAIDAAGRLARFSSRGSSDPDSPIHGKPDLVGPGVSVCGPRAHGVRGLKPAPEPAGDAYTLMDGTSMACPAIAGAAALVLSTARRSNGGSNGDGNAVTAASIRDVLIAACEPVPGTDPGFETGAGLLSVSAALVAVGDGDRPTVGQPRERAPERVEPAAVTPVSATADAAMVVPVGLARPAAATPVAPVGAQARALPVARSRFSGVDVETIPAPDADVADFSTLPRRDGRALVSPSCVAPTTFRTPPRSEAPPPPESSAMSASTENAGTLPAGAVTARRARKLETEFLAGFAARFYELPAIPNPLEGGRMLDVAPDGETESTYSERELVRKLLRERSHGADLRDIPHNAFKEIALIRRTGLMGPKVKKVVAVGACVSPLAEMIDVGYSTKKAGRGAITDLIDRIVDTQDTYFYLGIFSTTGWDDEVIRSMPQGPNVTVFLLDVDEEAGFRVHAPPQLDPAVRAAFDPETEETRAQRVHAFLERNVTLRSPGGFLLIEEVSEGANVSDEMAWRACQLYAKANGRLNCGTHKGARFLRRRRYD